ncbi:hypothetical protein R6Q59_014901, partial [Mikania micrantha]
AKLKSVKVENYTFQAESPFLSSCAKRLITPPVHHRWSTTVSHHRTTATGCRVRSSPLKQATSIKTYCSLLNFSP